MLIYLFASKKKCYALTETRQCAYCKCVILYPHLALFSVGPLHPKRQQRWRHNTEPRTHKHCCQRATTLPGKLSQFVGEQCFSNTTFVTSVQDTKRVDNELAGSTATGTMCLGRSTESSCRVFNIGHQDSPVERTAITGVKARACHKSHTSTRRLRQGHQRSITQGRQHQAFNTHNVLINLT